MEIATRSKPITCIRKLVLWSMYAIALLPIARNAISSTSIIAFLFFSLLYKYFSKPRSTDWKSFLLLSGNFIFFAISLLYTINFSVGFKDVIGELISIVLPLSFFILIPDIELSKKEKDNILNVFTTACLLLCLWLYFRLWQLGLFPKWDSSVPFVTGFRDTIDSLTRKHPTYISLYLSMACFLSMNNFFETTSLTKKIAHLISLVLFFGLLLLIGARTPILAFFIGSIIVLFWKIKSTRLKWSISISILIVLAAAIRFTPSLYSRMSETKNTQFIAPIAENYNSTNLRAGIYNCSWEAITEHWLIGGGVSSAKKLLPACYSKFPTDAYTKQYYNTHNQYFHFWLETGILSLLLFIGSILYAARIAINKRDHVMLFFILICCLCFLTENVLSRQAGMVFYYFFICLMIHYHKVNRTSTTGPNAWLQS